MKRQRITTEEQARAAGLITLTDALDGLAKLGIDMGPHPLRRIRHDLAKKLYPARKVPRPVIVRTPTGRVGFFRSTIIREEAKLRNPDYSDKWEILLAGHRAKETTETTLELMLLAPSQAEVEAIRADAVRTFESYSRGGGELPLEKYIPGYILDRVGLLMENRRREYSRADWILKLTELEWMDFGGLLQNEDRTWVAFIRMMIAIPREAFRLLQVGDYTSRQRAYGLLFIWDKQAGQFEAYLEGLIRTGHPTTSLPTAEDRTRATVPPTDNPPPATGEAQE